MILRAAEPPCHSCFRLYGVTVSPPYFFRFCICASATYAYGFQVALLISPPQLYLPWYFACFQISICYYKPMLARLACQPLTMMRQHDWGVSHRLAVIWRYFLRRLCRPCHYLWFRPIFSFQRVARILIASRAPSIYREYACAGAAVLSCLLPQRRAPPLPCWLLFPRPRIITGSSFSREHLPFRGCRLGIAERLYSAYCHLRFTTSLCPLCLQPLWPKSFQDTVCLWVTSWDYTTFHISSDACPLWLLFPHIDFW